MNLASQRTAEADLRKALHVARWPDGFRCPKCNHNKGYKRTTRELTECASRVCKYQASVTARTEFHKTRTPLQTWIEIAQLKKSTTKIDVVSVAAKHAISLQTVQAILAKIDGISYQSKIVSSKARELRALEDASTETLAGIAKETSSGRCCCAHIRSILVTLRDVVQNNIRAPASFSQS